MDLKLLSALLIVYSHNFHVLHWLASGVEFHTQHDKASEYYEKLAEDADYITEALMRFDEMPPSFKGAYELLDSASDKEFKIIEPDGLITMEQFVDETELLLTDVLYVIESLLEDELIQSVKSAGIRSQLETMHDYYDLQVRYLNKHRKV